MSTNGHNTLYPALYLYPLNDTWAPKHIALSSVHTKIGRQTSSKTAPGEKNGFFDSKVLSRQHAEVWEEGGKIYIKDVKSSNGTFINGERLSSEGHESDPFELKSDDIVEFGIDIVGEDNKTIIHHKVAARVVCVFSEQDAQVAARAEQHQQQQQLHQQQFMQQQQGGSHGASGMGGVGGVGGAGANGVGAQMNGLGVGGVGGNAFPQYSVQRRAQLAQQGLGAMAGMRAPGKTGLTFDVVMSRLQGELQKSRETGAELTSLSGALNEINDTLSGNVAANVPQFPSTLPPVRPPQEAPPSAPGQSSPIPGAIHVLRYRSIRYRSYPIPTRGYSVFVGISE
ncbi:SMAD/FHA domain-containing protein [Panaeolus papilionaceus]|nr:SMAD/FHA domain-containing protein [Panaeolus papilionaceus]